MRDASTARLGRLEVDTRVSSAAAVVTTRRHPRETKRLVFPFGRRPLSSQDVDNILRLCAPRTDMFAMARMATGEPVDGSRRVAA